MIKSWKASDLMYWLINCLLDSVAKETAVLEAVPLIPCVSKRQSVTTPAKPHYLRPLCDRRRVSHMENRVRTCAWIRVIRR